MNSAERAKITALQGCRLAWTYFDRTFVRNMAWVRDNDPRKTLNGRQKWGLDCLVYKYRRQLGGRDLPFDIPAEPPKLADYGVEQNTAAKQRNIFGGEDKPRRTKIDTGESTPQRSLF